jgi:hypothetical protein
VSSSLSAHDSQRTNFHIIKYFQVLPQSTHLHSQYTARNVGEKTLALYRSFTVCCPRNGPSSGLLEFYYTYSITIFFRIVFLRDVTSRTLVIGYQGRGGTFCFHTKWPPVATSSSTELVSTYKTARCHNLEYHNSETHP